MKNFAISGGHELTIGAAQEVLLSGGNAIDAAIAAYAVSFIAEPCMASVGAGGLANIYTKDKQSVILDFFCQTPAIKSFEKVSFFPIEVDFGVAKEVFHIGLGSAATPGAISGIYKMHELFGTMPLKELFHPAINHARTGIVLNDFQHYDLGLLQEIFTQDVRSNEIFFNGSEIKNIGEKIFMPHYADFLETLAIEGSDLFYRGEIAASIANDCAEFGGFLKYSDFADYETIIRKAISYKFGDEKIVLPGFPSLGGGLMVLFLDHLKQIEKNIEFLGKEHLNALYEAGKYVDPFKSNPEELEKALAPILEEIPDSYLDNQIKAGGTTHLNIIDKENNAVSLTTSIGEGCGYMIRNTDMMLNNMLGESALLPEGLHSWVPDTRLYSMMTPSLVLKNNKPELILGSGGAGRIPFMIAQVIMNYLLFNKDLHESVNCPRTHYNHGVMNVENGFETDNFRQDVEIAHWNPSLFFGGVHSISSDNGDFDAVGDTRRDGVSITN